MPWNRNFVGLLVNHHRQPDVTAVLQVFLFPHVEACYEGVFLALHGDNESALSVECLFGIRSRIRVSQNRPLSHNGVGHCQFGTVGIPTGTTAGKHIILVSVFEDGRCLPCHTNETAYIFSVRFGVIFSQPVDVHGLVFFWRRELVSSSVIVYEYGLVTAHRTVRAESVQILKRACRWIGDGYTGLCFTVVRTVYVHPHDKLLGLFVVNHFGTFEYLRRVDVAVRVVGNGFQSHSFEFPIQ